MTRRANVPLLPGRVGWAQLELTNEFLLTHYLLNSASLRCSFRSIRLPNIHFILSVTRSNFVCVCVCVTSSRGFEKLLVCLALVVFFDYVHIGSYDMIIFLTCPRLLPVLLDNEALKLVFAKTCSKHGCRLK